MSFTYAVRPADAVTARFWENGRQMDTAEFAKRSATHAFGGSPLGREAVEVAVSEAELEAGEFDQEYRGNEGLSDSDKTAILLSLFLALRWKEEKRSTGQSLPVWLRKRCLGTPRQE